MGEGSPLFHSALELLAHAVEHYASGQERDRKFMVLHLANAAELVLKDCLLDRGKSIYRNPKETKSVYAVIEELEESGTCIAHKHFLEILIDERNNIQHRFGSQSEIMAKWYMDRMIEFFEAFMSEQFDLSLGEYLLGLVSKDVLRYVYPGVVEEEPLVEARQVAKVHPSAAVLTAWMEIEKKIEELLRRAVAVGILPREERPIRLRTPLEVLTRLSGDLPREARGLLLDDFRTLALARNLIAHGKKAPDEKEARKLIDRTDKLLASLDELLAAIPRPHPDQGEEVASD